MQQPWGWRWETKTACFMGHRMVAPGCLADGKLGAPHLCVGVAEKWGQQRHAEQAKRCWPCLCIGQSGVSVITGLKTCRCCPTGLLPWARRPLTCRACRSRSASGGGPKVAGAQHEISVAWQGHLLSEPLPSLHASAGATNNRQQCIGLCTPHTCTTAGSVREVPRSPSPLHATLLLKPWQSSSHTCTTAGSASVDVSPSSSSLLAAILRRTAAQSSNKRVRPACAGLQRRASNKMRWTGQHGGRDPAQAGLSVATELGGAAAGRCWQAALLLNPAAFEARHGAAWCSTCAAWHSMCTATHCGA